MWRSGRCRGSSVQWLRQRVDRRGCEAYEIIDRQPSLRNEISILVS